jgi:hypothetical protein
MMSTLHGEVRQQVKKKLEAQSLLEEELLKSIQESFRISTEPKLLNAMKLMLA